MAVKRMIVSSNLFSDVFARIADSLRSHRMLLILALAMNMADAMTTQFGLAIGIPEGNPIPAMVLASGGRLALFGSKFVLMAALVFVVSLLGRRYPKLWHTFTVTNVVLLAVVLSNSAQILAH